ncbi:hypothetical protein CPLU01_04216 [Colletotrichum plurivorum]|uniref:Uncharacterized protein n=1 Tax=Colletotrichum plurivorum TaxID=2175906 RepID=A0A8H6KQB0_9PEZI|nr:hypothetical protein CPLU01_04216 [Colletotrichum plurivorum]
MTEGQVQQENQQPSLGRKRNISEVENEDNEDGTRKAKPRTRLPDHRPVPPDQGQQRAADTAPTQPPARRRSSYKRYVHITTDEEWSKEILEYSKDAPIITLRFDALFRFTDERVDELLQQGNWLRNLHKLEIGSLDTRLPLTDAGFSRFVNACPKVSTIWVSGAVHLTEQSLRAAIHACPEIWTISLCGADYEANAITGATLREIAQVDRAVREGAERGRLAPKLGRIGLKNTSIDPANVRLLRDERPKLRIGDSVW